MKFVLNGYHFRIQGKGTKVKPNLVETTTKEYRIHKGSLQSRYKKGSREWRTLKTVVYKIHNDETEKKSKRLKRTRPVYNAIRPFVPDFIDRKIQQRMKNHNSLAEAENIANRVPSNVRVEEWNDVKPYVRKQVSPRQRTRVLHNVGYEESNEISDENEIYDRDSDDYNEDEFEATLSDLGETSPSESDIM
jgi:hypothetical protein